MLAPTCEIGPESLNVCCGDVAAFPSGAEFQIGDALDVDHAMISAHQQQLIASKVAGVSGTATSSQKKIEDDDLCVKPSLLPPPVRGSDSRKLPSLCDTRPKMLFTRFPCLVCSWSPEPSPLSPPTDDCDVCMFVSLFMCAA